MTEPEKNQKKETKNLSSVLTRLIKHNSVSFRELSKAVDITHAHLHRLAAGKSQRPNFDTLKKLADFFGVSISQLTGEQKIDFNNQAKGPNLSKN